MVLLEHVLYYSIIENYFHRVLIRPEAAEASKIWGLILFKRLSLSASVFRSILAKPWIWMSVSMESYN